MATLIDLFAQVAERWGLLIVFVVTFLETSAMLGLVVPGETVVLLAGALASQGVMDIRALIVVVCVAGLLGDNVGYLLGRRLGRDFLLRHGRYVRLRESHLDRTEAYFAGHGASTILFGRWIGLVRSLLPFVAGSARMFYPRFAIYDFVGTVTWAVASCMLGYLFGASYTLVDQWLGRLSLFVLATLVAGGVLWLFGRYLSRRRAGLEGLAGRMTDRVLDWRPVRAVRRRFAAQIDWVLGRFSPRRVYGLGLTAGLVMTVAFGWAFGAIMRAVLGRGSLTGLDTWVGELILDNRIPWLTQVMKVVTVLGAAWVLIPAAALIAAVLVWRHRRWDALALVTSVVGSLGLAWVLQELVQRPRPPAPFPLVIETSYSFPSAHTAGAAAFYGVMAVLATGWVRSWEARVYLLVGALGMTLLVGFSRVYLGVHYASDVLAGAALGAGWLTLCVTAATVLARAQHARVGPSPLADPAQVDEGA